MTEAEKLLRACRNELYGSAPDELIDRIDAYLAAAPAAAHTDHPMRHWDRTCPACIAESGSQPRSDCGGYADGKPFTGITPPRSDTPETDALETRLTAEHSRTAVQNTLLQFSRSLERQRDAAVEELKQVGGSSALGWMQSARKWQQRAEQAEREREEVERLKLFIAETGARLTKEMYRDDDNRLGLSYDCKALAGDEMNTQYLTVQWQTERAIKAEQRFSDLQETLNPNSIGFLLANRLIDTEERAEQAQKDSEQGWQAFYALRKQVAADKYPMLTNIVRAAAPQGHGHITGTADVDAMNAEAWRQDASAEAIDAAQAKSGKP